MQLKKGCKVLHKVAPYVLGLALSARKGRWKRTVSEKRACRPLFGTLTAAKAAPTYLYVFWMSLFGTNSGLLLFAGGRWPTRTQSSSRKKAAQFNCRAHRLLLGT